MVGVANALMLCNSAAGVWSRISLNKKQKANGTKEVNDKTIIQKTTKDSPSKPTTIACIPLRKLQLMLFCLMVCMSGVESSANGAATFETLPLSFVPQSETVLPNPLLLNKKAKVVEQHGSFGRHFQGNIFQQFDLIGEETSMVRGTCDLEKDQVKNLNERNTNLNERNTNLKAQLDAMRKENEELKRPLLGPALSSTSVRTEAQTMGTTKNNANGVVLDNVPPTNDDKLDHLASNVACQDRRKECPLGKTGTTMFC
jgi:hypothetical protein